MEILPHNNTHINGWYISYKSQLLEMGQQFGLKAEEIKDIINQFFLDLLEKQVDPEKVTNPQAFIKTCLKGD